MNKREDLAAFQSFYKETAARLEKKIRAYNREIRKEKNPLIRTYREDLADMNEGGKMLRGLLIELGYRIASGNENTEYADDLAIAFEMFQTGVLIHDDIIDNADIRRGKMTIQNRSLSRMQVRGTKMMSTAETPENLAKSTALCTGDLGLYYANLKIVEAYGDSPILGKLITCFDRIILDTIRGELLDVVLPYELQNETYSEEEVLKILERSISDIYHLKTACYSVIGPLHLGMLLGGASEEEMAKMDRFGDEIGVAYQMMDDILGIFSEDEYLGKDVGSDISEFKQTILYMYVRMNRQDYYRELMNFYGKKVTSDDELAAVQRIFRESGALDYATDSMRDCFRRALAKLSRIRFIGDEERRILRGFIFYCESRKK